MGFEEVRAKFHDEPTLADEVAMFGDDGEFEFMNLLEPRTGVPGVIKVTTVMGAHGPRVKYYLGRPGLEQPSFSVSIGPEPRVLASSLSARDTQKHAPAVVEWVKLNHEHLADFWFNGNDLPVEQLDGFAATLEKI